MAKNELKIIISANSAGLKKGMKDAEDHVASLADKANTLLGQMQSNWFAVVGAITGAGYTVMKVTDEIDQAVGRLDRRLAFENLAASVGRNADRMVRDVRRVSGDILSLQDTIDATGRAILLGLEPHTITKLMEIASASTKVTGQSISQAFDDITLGVARQSKMILDNLGIMLDYDKHLKLLALSLNKTESQLTDADRRQAFLNATFESGDVMVKRIGNSYNELSERLKQAKAHLSDVTTEMKDQIFLNEGETAVKFYEDLAYTIEHQYIPIIKLLQKAYEKASGVARDFYDIVIYPISGIEIGKTLDMLIELVRNHKEVKRLQRETEGNRLRIFDSDNYIQNMSDKATNLEYKEIRQQLENTLAAFDAMADESLRGVDSKIKAESEAYKQLKVKTTDWLRHNIRAIQEERDAFISAGVNKLLAEQIFNEKRKALTEEFVTSRFVKSDEADQAKTSSRDIQETYSDMYDALGFDAKGYYDFRKDLLEKQRAEEISITGDITLAWEAYYARKKELDNERIRHSGSAFEGVKLFFDENSRDAQSWANSVADGMNNIKSSMTSGFAETIREAESFSDLMKGIFDTMVDSILNSLAKIAADQFVNGLWGMLGSLFTSAAIGAGTSAIAGGYTGGGSSGGGGSVFSGGGVDYNGITGFTASSRNYESRQTVNNFTYNILDDDALQRKINDGIRRSLRNNNIRQDIKAIR